MAGPVHYPKLINEVGNICDKILAKNNTQKSDTDKQKDKKKQKK